MLPLETQATQHHTFDICRQLKEPQGLATTSVHDTRSRYGYIHLEHLSTSTPQRHNNDAHDIRDPARTVSPVTALSCGQRVYG